MATVSRAEEALAYWTAMQDANTLRRDGRSALQLADELDVMALHTDWPLLRKTCATNLALINPDLAAACESSA
jgi:hypothetical protein